MWPDSTAIQRTVSKQLRKCARLSEHCNDELLWLLFFSLLVCSSQASRVCQLSSSSSSSPPPQPQPPSKPPQEPQFPSKGVLLRCAGSRIFLHQLATATGSSKQPLAVLKETSVQPQQPRAAAPASVAASQQRSSSQVILCAALLQQPGPALLTVARGSVCIFGLMVGCMHC